MNKFVKFAVAVASVAAVTVSAFAITGCEKHNMGEWQRSETEHWRVCTNPGCDYEERETHATDSKCSVCGAHFKALGLGFTSFDPGYDPAHADFAIEANEWLAKQAEEKIFSYDASTDFGLLTEENLKNYDCVLFFNNKPGTEEQWKAFKNYVENGGAWLGFHAAGFAMYSNWPNDIGKVPEFKDNKQTERYADWYREYEGWYQYEFLGCGQYGGCERPASDGGFPYYDNTWNPTREPLKIETWNHLSTQFIELVSKPDPESEVEKDIMMYEDEFFSAPCEWYEWTKDLKVNNDMTVLVTLNPTHDRPAGDDTRKGANYEKQIWYEGHHPIAWANKNYNMVYMNWGHNLRDYNDGKYGKESKTFSCPEQCQFVLNSMFGLVTRELP